MNPIRGDYDTYAPTYVWARWAVPWVVGPLAQSAAVLPRGATVLEIGCGTGNYIWALFNVHPELVYVGFDVSEPMLDQARSRGSAVTFVLGDASTRFPFPDESLALAFAVDVIHHVDALPRFFNEAHRVLAPSGKLIIVTDSEGTLRRRSLTRFFPEILPIELARYPPIPLLHKEAMRAGFHFVSQQEATGHVALDDEFLTRLEAKCSSAMRLMDPDAHAAGMARVREAGARGEHWLSCYDILVYSRPRVDVTA
jgi:SAM-dependent methyltransferase